MLLCAPLPCPGLTAGAGPAGGALRGRRAPLFSERDSGEKLHMPGGKAAPSPAEATPGALGESLQRISSALRARPEEPTLSRSGWERRHTTPTAPPAQPHLASLATEKRRRAGSSRQSVAYAPSPRPAFLSAAAATARGPALQNGGCSLFAATGARRFHPPCRGPRPRVPPPPRPPR